MNKYLSVIVPVYNVEDYLHKCIDSIINQTFNDLEIILVNDGATDTSPQICDAYAKKGIAWIVYSYEKNPDEALRILNSVTNTFFAPDYYLLKADIFEYKGDLPIYEFITSKKNFELKFDNSNFIFTFDLFVVAVNKR